MNEQVHPAFEGILATMSGDEMARAENVDLEDGRDGDAEMIFAEELRKSECDRAMNGMFGESMEILDNLTIK